jgi:hypothetical protein
LSQETLALTKAVIASEAVRAAPEGEAEFVIECSIQDPATDTVAIDERGDMVRNKDGSVYRRPAGHGALLANLAALDADIVCIKNIDNIVPDHLKSAANAFKPVLGGLLLELQAQIFAYLAELDSTDVEPSSLATMLSFARNTLNAPDVPVAPANSASQDDTGASMDAVKTYLRQRFDRPIRVCGVVPSAGEPGGGPFWTKDPHFPLQIVESASVQLGDDDQARVWNSSTHFNPVDLTCGLRDRHGKPYDLQAFVAPDSALIVDKTLHGSAIRALELPGLWNGAMAYWNTIFVEVPLLSFNPVKTVFDLLRETHQPE